MIIAASDLNVWSGRRVFMRRIRLWSVAVVVLATTLSMGAQSTAGKRDIVLQLSFNGATPQLRVTEGETGTVELTNVGKFGFVPAFQDGSDRIVVVELFDLKATPHRRIDRLEAVVGGDTIQSNTKPQFGVRVVRVVTR
jgi:hypothetical protein